MSVPMLVSTEWLAAHRQDPDLRIVDVRWYLFDKTRTGRSEYENGHIPGAVFMDVDTELAAPGHGPGRHPLPSPESFASSAARAGIGAHTYVIAYDDHGGETAGRLWWLLRYFGHDRVSLLDGGLVQWVAEGRPLEKDIPKVAPASFVAVPHPEMKVDQNTVDVLRQDPRAVVYDVRVTPRYEGTFEPIDPRAGHVPGARSAPMGDNVRSAEDLRFREPADLRQRFQNLGADRAEKVVCYCGSGVNACQTVFALTLAGFEALLYEGSWSDWSRNTEREAATGPNP